MTRPSIAGIVFDVGSVLARVSYDTISECLSRHSPLAPDDIRRHLIGTDLEVDSETGKYDSREYFRRVKQRIQGEPDWQYDQFVTEFKSGLTMTADGEAALRFAHARARVFLMSNTGYLHAQWIFEQEVMATLPEQHFFSFREGIMKPDPQLWQIFFARTGLTPGQCLFIDDRLDNCEGAAGLGIQTERFRIGETSLSALLRRCLPDRA